MRWLSGQGERRKAVWAAKLARMEAFSWLIVLQFQQGGLAYQVGGPRNPRSKQCNDVERPKERRADERNWGVELSGFLSPREEPSYLFCPSPEFQHHSAPGFSSSRWSGCIPSCLPGVCSRNSLSGSLGATLWLAGWGEGCWALEACISTASTLF